MPRTRVPAKLENLEKLQKFIADFAGNQGFSDKRIMEIELACEEALVNIFNYAYPDGKQGDVEVDCNVDHKGDFIIELADTGQPFDLKALPEPDLNADVSERRIGGLGNVLIKKFVDEIKYQRRQNQNFLIFKF
jgi:serine/threonine-protein kinase RsbW